MRARIYAALVAVVFLACGLDAHAASNAWSNSTALTGTACNTAPASVPSSGAAVAHHQTGADACIKSSVHAGCSYGSGSAPITGTTNKTLTSTLLSQGSGCFPGTPNTEVWNFTDDCASISKTYNGTYGGCAEVCVLPDTLDTSTGLCVAPPDCSEVEGRAADRFFSDTGPGGPICANPPGSESGDCSAVVANPSGLRSCADGECFARVVFTGDQCGAEPDATSEPLEDEPGNQNCIAGGGVTVCAAQDSKNCGTVNGQSVCLESVPPGRCAFLSNGGLVCSDSAPGPTESDGVTPATPDGTFTASSDDSAEDTFNYYGPGTVASSGTPISGGSSSSSSDGPLEEEDDECADGACEGVLPSISEQQTFSASTAALFAGLEGTAWGSAFVAPVDDIPTGACPSESFEMFGATYSIDVACELWPELEPILSACFIFAYILIGIRIVASA